MVVENGKVTHLAVEPPGGFEVSKAESVLAGAVTSAAGRGAGQAGARDVRRRFDAVRRGRCSAMYPASASVTGWRASGPRSMQDAEFGQRRQALLGPQRRAGLPAPRTRCATVTARPASTGACVPICVADVIGDAVVPPGRLERPDRGRTRQLQWSAASATRQRVLPVRRVAGRGDPDQRSAPQRRGGPARRLVALRTQRQVQLVRRAAAPPARWRAGTCTSTWTEGWLSANRFRICGR